MQYCLRFYLSVVVLCTHMWATVFGGAGSFAVTGFFVISGYVITKVLNERYFLIKNGFQKFWVNRFLRLYPTYIVSVLVGFGAAYFLPNFAADLNVGISLPASEDGINRMAKAGISQDSSWIIYIMNLSGIGMQSPFIWKSPIAFSPNSWSTNVELYFYLILSLGTAASVLRVRWLVILGATFVASVFIIWLGSTLNIWPSPARILGTNNWPIKVYYFSFFGWTILFGIGGLAYFFPKKEYSFLIKFTLIVCCCLGPLILPKSPSILWIICLTVYGIIIGCSLIVFSDNRGNKFVRFLGDTSYPLFMLHWPIAAYVSWGAGISKNNIQMLLLGGAASLIAATIMVLLVERPIENIRKRFRN